MCFYIVMSEKRQHPSNEPLTNGESVNSTTTSKYTQPRRSLKKFQIQSVDVSEDPLYNKDGSRPTTPNTPPAASSGHVRSSSPTDVDTLSSLASPNFPVTLSEERPPDADPYTPTFSLDGPHVSVGGIMVAFNIVH